MAINFDGLGTSATTVSQEAPNEVSGASLNLSKNMTLDLTKRNPGLTNIVLGIGWDIAEAGLNYDLDLSAFMLHNGKILSVEDVIYFKNKKAHGIKLHKDNRTGEGEGDDERIDVSLNKIDPDVDSIVFCVTIFDAVNKNQTFGKIRNSFVRLINKENDKELCKFSLNTDFSTDTAIIFVKLKRNGSEWDFETIGEGKQADLNGLLAYFS